jgi:gluconokinase
VVVAGVSGSGKSTVGKRLAEQLNWPFIDGDSLHPAANIAKMSAGVPLTDEDRAPWLDAVAAEMDRRNDASRPAVIACSALKRRYRDRLLDHRPGAVMVFLLIGRDVAAGRLAARPGHFFGPDLLGSQFADLEPPSQDERSVVLMPADHAPGKLADQIIARLGLTQLG